jgi:hypothetical protein
MRSRTFVTPHNVIEIIKTNAERLLREQQERAEKRRLELAEQRSDLNPPEVRIRTWERIHGLRLPSDPDHPIVDVIAVTTRLTIEEVQKEQRQRALRNGAGDGLSAPGAAAASPPGTGT